MDYVSLYALIILKWTGRRIHSNLFQHEYQIFSNAELARTWDEHVSVSPPAIPLFHIFEGLILGFSLLALTT